jgi:hypothetical protein
MAWLRVLLAAGLLVALACTSDARQDRDKTSKPDRTDKDKTEKKDKDDIPLGEKGWDVEAFDAGPFKLIRTSYDKEAREMRWVVEFTRDLGDGEAGGPGDWMEHRSPFTVRLRDEDGVGLKSIYATSAGEFRTRKGERVRVVFALPPEEDWVKVKSAVVVGPFKKDKKDEKKDDKKDDKKDGK